MRKYRVYYHNPATMDGGFPLYCIRDEYGNPYVMNAKGKIVSSFLSKDFDTKEEALKYVENGEKDK